MFELTDVPLGEGWVMIVDLSTSEPPVALFAPEWRKIAQGVADQLNGLVPGPRIPEQGFGETSGY